MKTRRLIREFPVGGSLFFHQFSIGTLVPSIAKIGTCHLEVNRVCFKNGNPKGVFFIIRQADKIRFIGCHKRTLVIKNVL